MLPLAVCIFALVFMFSGNVISNDLYKANTQTTNAEKTMKRTVTDVASIWFSDYKNNQQAANANGGQLSFFTSLEITDATVMRLKLVPFTEDSIFLRAYIGSLYEYNENKWEHIPEETEYTNAAQQALKESEDEGDKVEITLCGEMNRPFDSYGSVSDSIEYKSDDDFDYVDEGTRNYELEIYNKSYANDEYKAFVYDKYLQLSDENRVVIDKIVSEKNITKENLLPELNDYFKSDFDFEYSTEVTPFGKDYVNTFLTETKTGNFVHFATAATLIYRSFGIPARYVTGYRIPYELVMSSDDDGAEATLTDRSIYPKIKNVNVTNENLYAWVEIYDDNKGWVPCDVCGDIYEELVNESTDVEENENKDKNSTSEKKHKKELFKSYFETAYTSEKTEKGKDSVKAFVHSALKVLAKVIAFALGAVLLLYLLYKLITILKFALSSNNKKAEAIFKALEKKTGVNGGIRAVSEELAKFGFDEEDKNKLTEVMQKAMFSKDGASTEDIEIIIRLYKKAKTVYKKRKYCK
jgi:transglutaminase-like putative cysteine protease